MNGIKRLLFGTATFGLGAVAGYFICKRKLRDQYREDVAEVQAFYRERLDELCMTPDDFEPDESDGDEYDAEAEAQKAEVINNYRGEKRRYTVDYTKPSLEELGRSLREGASVVVDSNGEDKLGDVDPGEEVIDPDYEAEMEQAAEEYARKRTENMKRGDPYLIEPEEYRDGPVEYEHQALYYYAKDRTLCEDDDSQVDDEEACVGFDYEDKLDMQTTCWVRNDKMRVLYEIHRIDDYYTKAVLGISETPREREFRIQGRRKQALDNR